MGWAHLEKCWAGWVTSWNQDWWEKHQQLQARIYNRAKTVSPVSDVGKVGEPQINEVIMHFHIIHRVFSDINSTKVFLVQFPKVIKIKAKINKWNLIKLESFCTAKTTTDKMKDKLQKGRKYLQMIWSTTGNYLKYIINSDKWISKNKQPNWKWA